VSHELGEAVSILIVDDEAMFRQTLGRLLKRQGFQVLEADSAETAFAALRDSDLSVDVMVTDVVMPGIGGVALADRAQKLYPGMKVLFMSGYPFRTLERDYGMSPNLLPFFLTKPFRLEALTKMVGELPQPQNPSEA
jgi:two-component system cell cycle sensor histidine kinase/response regulator CckA